MSITPRIPAFIDRTRENTPLEYTIRNTTETWIDVGWWKGMDSSGLALHATGFTPSQGDFLGQIANDPNFATRFDWRLFAGGMYSIDDEPVWEGSTYWKPEGVRNGQMVQVTGMASSEWLLQVKIADPGNSVGAFVITGSLSWRLPDYPIIGGPLIATGSFIG